MSKLFASVAVSAPMPAPSPGPTRVFVRDLVMEAMIGVYAHERDAAQRIRVNLDLDLEPEIDPAVPAPSGEDAAALVRAEVGRGHVMLVETLAERLAERCLADARVRGVRARVEKLDVFPDAASVGVEIVRGRG
ncbi:dihydroneopterin aldolase [Azospirillum halopraeferens]|uniref:dihydroneopterin aldolase n=1 Tax=Azospirillum halopraeferens TaxID=34010 RepID=UPI000425F1CE|nr:dihydroneopterin aldolase [Azospirillum halopraeferens]